jgi:hypothetical protein
MKLLASCLLLAVGALALTATGCVQTMYSKSVTVKKDASGNVTGIEESECVTQPGQQPKYIRFEHLKAKSADAEPLTPK